MNNTINPLGNPTAQAEAELRILDLDALPDENVNASLNFAVDEPALTSRVTLQQVSQFIRNEIQESDIPVLTPQKIPVAVNSPDAAQGFGGFRYQTDGTNLNLFTS